MALSLDGLRNLIQTSIFGRRLGLDANDNLQGVRALRWAVEDISTTAATSAIGYGVTRALCSGSSQNGQYTLQAIPVGATKTFVLGTTSTGTQQFTMPSGVTLYNTSAGTSCAVVSLTYPGASVTLLAVSSDKYYAVAQTGSSALAAANSVLFTTTT